ncbi:MAG TPA: hypothetical protein VG370_33450 [Chloroflexota bacterium]|jgi:hypothetical protein|nr:hypothetical protein [Chloroflexota bacterium]
MEEGWVGPWVQNACFCENAIFDAQQVLTLVRVVDRVTVNPPAPGSSGVMIVPTLYLVVGLKAGDARGRGTVSIEAEGPDGLRRGESQPFSVLFESPDRGHAIVLQFQIPFQEEGLHWYTVRYEGRLLTRLPLRVIHEQPARTGPR